MMFSALKKCDIASPDIPQDVKEFCEQVNRDFWPMDCNPFEIYVSERDDQYYMLILRLENTHISVSEFGTSNITEAIVSVTFEDMPRQRIYASVGNIPRDKVGERAADFFYWIGDLVDNPNMNFLDIMDCCT